MKINDLNLMIGGFAGQGVQTVGNIFARLCSRAGLYVFVNQEYPSNIKGEHNFVQIMVSENEIGSHDRSVDLLLVLDLKTLLLHQDDIKPGGALIFDSEGLEISHIDTGLKQDIKWRNDITVIDMPFRKITKDVGGSKKMINSVGLGAIIGLLRIDFELLSAILKTSLFKFEDKVIEQNIEGARIAYDSVRDNFTNEFNIVLEKRKAPERMLLTGNDAVAMGALKAGLKLYTSYPMTPSSAVLGYLGKHSRETDMVAVLPEDEISAAGIAIGASFTGARAMTGTSGGGFCLMTEHFGLAGMAEIPLVFLEGQRPGPATGLPTRTEQADLKFVLSAHQGDFPRIVIAPGDPSEAFYLTFDAFNLADKYQTPVILLTDKHLAESYWTYAPFNTAGMIIDRGDILQENKLSKINDYRRYANTDSGISPRTLPGTPGGVYKATGNEHNEYGLTSEEPDIRSLQMDKRLRKTFALDVSEIGLKLHGEPHAEVTIVGWGSTKLAIIDAISILKNQYGKSCNFLQIIYMEPFPTDRVFDLLQMTVHTILVENNASAQLGALIREKTGLEIKNRILKYNGRQFFRDELVESINQYL